MKKKKSYPSHKSVHLLGKVARVVNDGIEEYKTVLNAPQYLRFFLKKHAHPGDEVLIVVTVKRPLRSQAQNNFLHVYLDLISLSCGHTIDELHAWVNEKILGKGITEVFGTEIRKVGSTSALNISEFCEMMNRIHEETEIPIPDPAPFNVPLTYDEYGKLKLIQQTTYAKMRNKLSDRETL